MKKILSPGSLARAASRHPLLTIGLWVAAIAVAIVLSTTFMGSALTTDTTITNNPESKQASDLIEERLGATDQTLEEIVIVRSDSLTVDDPAYRTFVEGLFGNLMATGDTVVSGGMHYYMTGEESLVSSDRHAMLIPIVMPSDATEQVDKLHAVVDSADGQGVFETYITGDATMEEEMMAIAETDMRTGEILGISVALVVLAVVFGAVAAALLPIALGIAAVVLALGTTALVGQAFNLSFMVTNMITMMGLAVGIDYSLFVVSRYREERSKGLNKLDAIAAAGSTASRAVLFSGFTVVLALCGLLLFPLSIFQSMGTGAILVVAAAVLACLTLLPAILSLLGDKVNALKVRIPLRRPSTSRVQSASNSGFWGRSAAMVMRRPLICLFVAGGLLLALAAPFLDMNKGFAGISTIPDGTRSKEGFLVLQQEFGYGQDMPATVVIDSTADAESLQLAIERLEASLASDSAFIPMGLQAHPDVNLSVFYTRLAGDPMSKESTDAVVRLRNEYIPAAFQGVDANVVVGGGTAEILDFNATTDTYTPIIFAFVLGLSFLLLTVAFRSVVVPVTSIIMNLLSVGAAYGLLVLVFQKGFGTGLLGFERVDSVETWLPLFLFSVLFGLSMDYHVFLLSRIRERFNQTGDNTEAVGFGLRSTGRLITGAALIMVAVFGGFAMGDMVVMQEMGFGLAVAVFMDATVVRSVLVPATMRLLGKWNWYLPRWLAWIPQVGIGEHEKEEHVRAPRKPVLKPVPEAIPLQND